MSGRFFTIGEISRLCSIPLLDVMDWVDQRRLPVIGLPGRPRRVRSEHLFRFLKEENRPIPAAVHGNEKRILDVDDDPGVLRGLSRLFRSIGGRWRVESAQDGIEAGEKVCSFYPDLVILDLMLPKADGFEVCRTIRQVRGVTSVKILAFSGLRSPDVEEKILEVGADDFIGKPFDMDVLSGKIMALVGSA